MLVHSFKIKIELPQLSEICFFSFLPYKILIIFLHKIKKTHFLIFTHTPPPITLLLILSF